MVFPILNVCGRQYQPLMLLHILNESFTFTVSLVLSEAGTPNLGEKA